MQISAGDQAAGEPKVQDESRSQGCSQFQGKERSGAHQDGRPVKDCSPVFSVAGKAMRRSNVTRWDGSPR